MLGIVVCTKNRPKFLLRQFNYYADLGFRHTIYLGDSSEPDYLEQVTGVVQRYQDRLNMVYISLPGLGPTAAPTEVIQLVKEPYVALLGDDDFLVPSALERCVSFLDTHSDFTAAHGVAALCVLESSGDDRTVIAGSSEYSQRAVEHTSATERLMDYLQNYFVVHFSVHRTQDFVSALDATRKIPDEAFTELVSGCFSVIRGKSKQFDCFGLVRQTHERRQLLPDIFDWVTNPDWLPSYLAFRDCLAEELALQDSISMGEAQRVVKKAFWAYLGRTLSAKWQGRYRSSDAGILGPARRAGRVIPGGRKAWRLWAKFRTGASPTNTNMSLPEMLHPSSPYYADFMPIYRTITSPVMKLERAGTQSVAT